MEMTTRINHLAVVATRPMLVGRFFQAHFNLDPWSKSPVKDRGLHATDGYVGLAILQRNPGRKAGFDHWGFEVEDIAAVRDYVRKHFADCKALGRPSNRPFASISMNDPAGNVFDLSQEGMSNRRGAYTEKDIPEGSPTVSHFMLRAMDISQLAEFYTSVFGLKEVSSDDKRSIAVSDGTVQMILEPWDIEAFTGGGLERSPGLDHFGFRVSSLSAFRDNMSKLARSNPAIAPQTLDATDEQKVRRDLLRQCELGGVQFADPDGILLDVGE